MSDNGLSIDLDKTPWPDETTNVFRAGDKVWSLVWLPKTSQQWNLFADGYRDAAERLFEGWQESQCCPDHLIYPMIFLYRHYVELRLKELLQATDALLSSPAKWKANHQLIELWTQLRPRLAQIVPESDACTSAERLIQELADFDSRSLLLRYPSESQGECTTTKLRKLDVDNFFHAMRQLAAYLDSASYGISEHIQCERENRAL